MNNFYKHIKKKTITNIKSKKKKKTVKYFCFR